MLSYSLADRLQRPILPGGCRGRSVGRCRARRTVYLPILTALLAGVRFLGGLEAVGVSLLVITVVLVVALKFGRYVSALVDSPDREVFLLKVLGGALLVAGIASALQVSAAVGAFLLGIAISGSTAENATRLLEPLRDLFAAMFFVVFGLNTDPAAIPPVLGWAVVLAVVTTLTKVATGWWAARRQGIGRLGRARAGAALVARGEFSIVIAGLAVGYGAVERRPQPPRESATLTIRLHSFWRFRQYRVPRSKIASRVKVWPCQLNCILARKERTLSGGRSGGSDTR
jgi:Kef-type K+ transport system membrane component KefB